MDYFIDKLREKTVIEVVPLPTNLCPQISMYSFGANSTVPEIELLEISAVLLTLIKLLVSIKELPPAPFFLIKKA